MGLMVGGLFGGDGLGGGFPDPVEGVVMVDSITFNDHAPGFGIGCFFNFLTNGELRHLPVDSPTYINYDGAQWHEEWPTLTTRPISYYGFRATKISYNPGAGSGAGSGSTFQTVFTSFFDEPYASGTPTPWRQGNAFGGNGVSMERWSGTGAGTDNGVVLMECCRWSDKVILASAVYNMTDTVA